MPLTDQITFTNSVGEFLSPILLPIRSTGFFEAFVFMPVMTIMAIAWFLMLRRRIEANGTFDGSETTLQRRLFLAGYFALCFLGANTVAVAFKTFIVQELDYERAHWFIPYIAPLHFYIASVVVTHVWLVWTNSSDALTRWACAYVQLGLVGGYAISGYRLLNEPFELTDVTTGTSGIYMSLFFAILNWDLIRRMVRPLRADACPQIAI